MSIQTNYASLVAQQNLATNSAFQQSTIVKLTSGYRINQSGDDAAGLAVANRLRSNIAELTQGVLNANDGVSAMQIVDGGLNNITQMLDRLKTLATQSASSTFTGDRSNINVEYQQLVSDISRQASNIGLQANGRYNTVNTVYIGGGNNQSNAQISIDLSGASNQVDAAGLGISNSSVAGGGAELAGNSVRLDAPGATFLAAAGQTFNFNVFSGGQASTVSFTVGGAGALTKDQVLSAVNSNLASYNITASVAADGQLSFAGSVPFTVSTTTAATDSIATTASTATNSGVYAAAGQATFGAVASGKTEVLTFQSAQGTASVTLDTVSGASLSTALAAINNQTASIGVYAVKNTAGTGISFQSVNSFTVSDNGTNKTGATEGVFNNASIAAQTVTSPTATATATGNAMAALTAIDNALRQVGNVQSVVGAGQNKLTYAIDLANSQIQSFSAAQSRIRDADVAKEAANLSKAQVLNQSSVAAMAQANQAPQMLLKLLQ